MNDFDTVLESMNEAGLVALHVLLCKARNETTTNYSEFSTLVRHVEAAGEGRFGSVEFDKGLVKAHKEAKQCSA